MSSEDHQSIYRNVPVWIAGEYIDRCKKAGFDAVREAYDEVDYELERLENKGNK